MSDFGLTNLTPAALLQAFLDINEGFLSTKYLALSSFVLLLYDHLTCLDQEIEYFWDGEWSLTRVLYFLNRYIPPWVFVVQSIYFFSEKPSLDFCTAAIRTTTAFEVFGMFVVEAVLVTRVFYLWSHSRAVRYFILVVFASLACIAIGFAGRAIHGLHGVYLPGQAQGGCISVGRGLYWPIFLPTFIIQTVLFVSTLLRILQPMRHGTSRSVVNRLLRDGGFFYLVVCLSVGFTGIGSVELQHPQISTPALLSNSLLAIHSICASHLILSIQSLASDMGSDPTFLLSNIEISRVSWRRGSNDNELVVEVVDADDAEPLEYIDLHPLESYKDGKKGTLRSSRVGFFDSKTKQTELEFRSYAYKSA